MLNRSLLSTSLHIIVVADIIIELSFEISMASSGRGSDVSSPYEFSVPNELSISMIYHY